MDDLISRRTVIDRINKQREHLHPDTDTRDFIGNCAYNICIEFIERLPSAQPNNECEKCVFSPFKQFRQTAQSEQQWIPCSERLPEKWGDYLVTSKWKGVGSETVYIETNMAVYNKRAEKWDHPDVIAWMPLPEPYTEK